MPANPGVLPDWNRAHGAPIFAATIRARPSDFQVVEILGFEPDGSGDHDFLWLEKAAANTDWVARQLARHAGVRTADVGYAGMKDRHAVTRQWFSLPRGRGTDWTSFDVDGVKILDVRRHHRKLRRGTHKGNAFRIALRSRDIAGVAGEIDERLSTIGARGVPNYFGPQRFGRQGANLDLARRLFGGSRLKRGRPAC